MKKSNLPVAIIGAGPVGLAAAAHLKKSNTPFVLFERGQDIASNIRSWAHVKLFSPWEYNIDKVAEELMKEANIPIPNKHKIPYGVEIISEYLKPLSEIIGIKENIRLNAEVLSVGRKGLDKMRTKGRNNLAFSIQVKENNKISLYEAKAVIDATGTWHNPNPAGSGGIFAIGEKENADRINYGMPDVSGSQLERFANKTVLVVGGGHSAIGSILSLNELKNEFPNTKIHWILRKKRLADVYGGKEADSFEARGSLGIMVEHLVQASRIEVHSPVYIYEIKKENETLNVIGRKGEQPFVLKGINEIITSTGSRPDFEFLREIRFDADAAIECVPAIADLIDPNIHSCGTVRAHGEAELRQKEKDFYVVGMKSYGRAPTFLMATGYEQIRSIVAYMKGDYEAAKSVQLHLPETGVCSTDIEIDNLSADDSCNNGELKTINIGCCGGAETIKTNSENRAESFIAITEIYKE